MSRPTDKQLFRYVSGQVSPQERLEITNWALENKDNDSEVRMLRKLFLASLLNTEPSSELASRQRFFSRAIVRWSAAAVSALAIMLLGVFIGGRYVSVTGEPDMLYPMLIQVPEGQRSHTFLSDGTEVWLNSNSKLFFNDSDKKYRQVLLDGEAWFDVSQNEQRPFVVATAKTKIQVLGTIFDVRAYNSDDSAVVKLYEGKVALSDAVNTPLCTLMPNEMCVVSDGGYEKKEIENDSTIDWNGGFYSFKNKTYSEIFRTIEAYYNIDIIVCNEKVGTYKCTARFKQEEPLHQILTSMALIHPFTWEWSDDNSTLSIY